MLWSFNPHYCLSNDNFHAINDAKIFRSFYAICLNNINASLLIFYSMNIMNVYCFSYSQYHIESNRFQIIFRVSLINKKYAALNLLNFHFISF